MNIDNQRLPVQMRVSIWNQSDYAGYYQKITLARAISIGIVRKAQCRVDGDGVERCYYPESGFYWENPGGFRARA